MADAANVFAAGLEGHGDSSLGNEFAGHGANDMHTQNFVGFCMRKELDQPGGVAQRARAAIGHKGEGASLVGHAIGLELLFGLAHPGDLW